jgi:short-subunit dehydrogenase
MFERGSFARRYGPWALVTGAGRGIGWEFARALGALGLGVVLVDRDGALLAERAPELDAASVRTVTCDVGREGFWGELEPHIADLDVGLVVSNAAARSLGPMLDAPLDEALEMVAVNVQAPCVLGHHFGRRLRARGRGGLVFVSSLSGLYGTPIVAGYAATKAFNLVLAEGLFSELRASGVDVLAVVPGITDTPGFWSSRPTTHSGAMTAAAVVAEALGALGRRPSHIAGGANRWGARALGLMPRSWATRLVARTMARMYPDRAMGR